MKRPSTGAIRMTALALAAALGGCAGLLPRGSAEASSAFASFAAARDAFERVQPHQTTTQQLREFGFDLHDSANVRQIPYPEVIARLAPNPNIPLEMLDGGIRECILARQACEAYQFNIGTQTRRRSGSFLLDFLNFRRTTYITGWRFEALVVMRDGVVLFRSYGGEPLIKQVERQANPLGPLQPAGESLGSQPFR